jgi:hypothetical protein
MAATAHLLAADELPWHDHDKKGRPRSRDCRPFLIDLAPHEPGVPGPAPEQPGSVTLELRARIDAQGRSLRPEHLRHWLSDVLAQPLRLGRIERCALMLRAC